MKKMTQKEFDALLLNPPADIKSIKFPSTELGIGLIKIEYVDGEIGEFEVVKDV